MGEFSDLDDDWLAHYTQRIRASLRGAGRILELGCGAGRDTVHLLEHGEVFGIDLSVASLRDCREYAAQAMLACCDLRRPLAFQSSSFPVAVASLCLHYYDWDTSRRLVAELRRVLTASGMLIVRVNSTNDTHHGSVGYPEIEPNLYNVDGFPKRFFDRQSLLDLFAGWRIEEIEERVIMRYEKPKSVWQLCLYAG